MGVLSLIRIHIMLTRPSQQLPLQAGNGIPIRTTTGNREEDLDGMISSESEANMDDEGRALSGVRDVLDEHQSKSGGSRAPDPDFLAEYARKLKVRSGLTHVDEEVRVCRDSAFSWKTPIHFISLLSYSGHPG